MSIKNHPIEDSILKIINPVAEDMVELGKELLNAVKSDNKLINAVCEYVIMSGGKRLRPVLAFLFAKALDNGVVSPHNMKIGIALEFIHTATLIHDDIIDDADLRRGKTTVNQVWDSKTAVIAGDFLLARALVYLAQIPDPRVMAVFAHTLSEVCEGEIQQSSQIKLIPSFDEYICKSERKTAMLFAAGTESAALICENSSNELVKSAREFSLAFGVSFQIVDDILNLIEDEKTTGKKQGLDIINGTITLPVIFALEELPSNQKIQIMHLLEKDDISESELQSVINCVLCTSGITRARAMAEEYSSRAEKSLSLLADSDYKNALIELVKFNLQRLA